MNDIKTYETIKKCRLMDRKAQEKLYKDYYNYAMSIALRYSGSRDDSVEILNDSFLKVFTKIKQFKPGQDFKGWIRRIIINTSIDKYRSSKNKLHSDPEPTEKIKVTSIEENVFDILNAEDIINVIQELPEVYRITFNLYEIEGYSHKEISKMLKINESKSRTNLSRAKQKLRALLTSNLHYEKR